MKYGFKCPCHGVQIFETQAQRDAFAITYQCRLEMFRIEPAADWCGRVLGPAVGA